MNVRQHFAGYMTKMAVMPIYGKTLKNLPGTTGQILMKLCMKHHRPKPFIISANYDPELTLTYITARSNFCNLGLYMGKCYNDEFFGNYCIL